MLTLEHFGAPLTWQSITPGNTVTTIAEGIWRYYEFWVPFTLGGTTVPVKGNVVVGATSSITAIIMEVDTTSSALFTGTWGGADQKGRLRVKSATGQFTPTELLKIVADADICTVTSNVQITGSYTNKFKEARCILVEAETNPQRIIFDCDGAKTDQTSTMGIVLAANQSIVITSPNAIRNLQTVDATAGTAGKTKIVGFF